MATTDIPLGLRTRAHDQLVGQLVRLFERADEFELSLHDLFDEAEERFLEVVDAERDGRHAGEGSPGEGSLGRANRRRHDGSPAERFFISQVME